MTKRGLIFKSFILGSMLTLAFSCGNNLTSNNLSSNNLSNTKKFELKSDRVCPPLVVLDSVGASVTSIFTDVTGSFQGNRDSRNFTSLPLSKYDRQQLKIEYKYDSCNKIIGANIGFIFQYSQELSDDALEVYNTALDLTSVDSEGGLHFSGKIIPGANNFWLSSHNSQAVEDNYRYYGICGNNIGMNIGYSSFNNSTASINVDIKDGQLTYSLIGLNSSEGYFGNGTPEHVVCQSSQTPIIISGSFSFKVKLPDGFCGKEDTDFVEQGFRTQGFRVKNASNNQLLPSELEPLKAPTQLLSDTSNSTTDLSILFNKELNNISNLTDKLNNQIAKGKPTGDTQIKLDVGNQNKQLLSSQINSSLSTLDLQRHDLYNVIDIVRGDHVLGNAEEPSPSPSPSEQPHQKTLQEYKDKILELDIEFDSKVNLANTFIFTEADYEIGEEAETYQDLVKDYIEGKLLDIQPSSDTEDLTRLDKLTKPIQVIKYLNNQIKNHNTKFPKEVLQLSNKVDNSIQKVMTKLLKVQSDLEAIKIKYNVNSFTTSSFHTKAVNATDIDTLKTLSASNAFTINSLKTSLAGNRAAANDLNKVIDIQNDTSDLSYDALDPTRNPHGCKEKPPAHIPRIEEDEEQDTNSLIFSDSCKSNGANSSKQAYQILSAYNFHFDGSDLTFVMSLNPEFVKANEGDKLINYNEMKKDIKGHVKVVAKEVGKPNIPVNLVGTNDIEHDEIVSPLYYSNNDTHLPADPKQDRVAIQNRANAGNKLSKIYLDLIDRPDFEFAKPPTTIKVPNPADPTKLIDSEVKYPELILFSLDLKRQVYPDLASGASNGKELTISINNHKIKLKISLDKDTKQGNLFKWKIECIE